MSRIIRRNNPSLRVIVDLWSKHCVLEKWHMEWARANITVLPPMKKGKVLYFEGEAQKNVYFVASGLAARVLFDADTDRRQILSVALPGMGLMTTDHLYSTTPSMGDITVLQSRSDIVQIPYSAIKAFKEKEPHIDTLIDILSNKKKKQLATLRRLTLHRSLLQRYINFANEMPVLQRSLTNQECADLLGISIDTVHRAKRKWSKA